MKEGNGVKPALFNDKETLSACAQANPQKKGESMKRSVMAITLFLLTCWPGHQANAQFGDLLKGIQKTLGGSSPSEDEIVRGLKEALQVGTGNAVGVVSREDGYYKNPKIRIPLPGSIQKAEKVLRAAGYGKEIDNFDLSMNRAAERAAPPAKALFLNSIKEMNIGDAKKILQGKENEATLYFKEKTSGQLEQVFKPIVHTAMSEVGVTRSYQNLDAKVRTIPFAEKMSFDLDQYVTKGALEGLFLMLAEEEKRIRQDPAARVSDLLKKVFGQQ